MFVGSWNHNEILPDLPGYIRVGDLMVDKKAQIYSLGNMDVCFLGILYNRKELGYADSLSDAQVVAELYKKQGNEAFARLDGSFTCILQTPDTKKVVRDHHGVATQLYWNESYLASSLSLLRDTPRFSAIPNRAMLARFLSIGYIATTGSALEGVSKLGAGSLLAYSVSAKRFDRINLFDVDSVQPVLSSAKSLNELSEEYGALHREAIRRRIADSSNVGILLSGGYDSGCNLAALRSIYSGDIHSYSIGFKGDNWTELPLARCMSDTFHTLHSEYEIDGSEIEALPQIVEHLGDPFVEGGLMVNYTAMRLIGDAKPDVILGGDGSDQYFGTSGREVALHYLVSKYGLKPVVRLFYNLLSQSRFDKDCKFYRIRFHLDKILNILDGDLFGFPGFRLEEMLQQPHYAKEAAILDAGLKPDTRSFEHLYTQHAYRGDLEKVINQIILFKASKMADMFNNRIAFPYMDLDLYNFLLQLPVGYKCKGENARAIAKGQSTAKFLLKYHYKPMLPEAITSKKKQGGFAPMPLFFKDDKQRARMADYIMQSAVTRDFLKREPVSAFLKTYDQEAHASGNWFWYKQNKAIQYFNLLTLAIWWEKFVEGK